MALAVEAANQKVRSDTCMKHAIPKYVFTHTVNLVGVGNNPHQGPFVMKVRQTKYYWVDSKLRKFRKADGKLTGYVDYLMWEIDLSTLQPIPED